MNNDVYFVDQTLRDGHQSLWATRMTTPMMLPIAPTIDEVGYRWVSLIGTAAPSACIYYLQENPFERLRLIVKAMPNTVVQASAGGVGSFNFQPKPDSVQELWIKCCVDNGARALGLTDTLGNYKTRDKKVKWAKKMGLKVDIALIFATTPVQTDEWYAKKAAEIAQMEPDSIWIKDSMGLLTPERTRTLVPVVLKNIGDIPLEFHSHCNTGLAPYCYLEAVRLGVRIIHTCVPPLAYGNSQPSALNMVRNLRLLGYNPVINEKALEDESAHFTYVAKREGKPVGAPVEYDVFQQKYGMAGGTRSNLMWMLEQRGMGNRWDEVVEEIYRMSKEWGYPPNITPYSQMMNVQAVLNLLSAERYDNVSDQVIMYLLGYYGPPPAPMDQNVVDKVSSLPQAKRFLNWELPQPSIEDLRKEIGRPGISDEELVLRVVYPQHLIDAMIAAGPIKDNYPREDKPVMALIKELTKRKDASYVHVEKKGFSLTLRRF